jgi:nucleotide-binding universal stress UspA family protein
MKMMTMRSNRTVAWFVDPANKSEPLVSRVGGACVEAARSGIERWHNRLAEQKPVPNFERPAAPKRKPVVLVPIDFSANTPEAVKTGVKLALETGVRLVLVHAVHLNLLPYGPANPAWLQEALCQEAMEKAEPFMRLAQSAGVQTICAVEAGVQSEVILKAAKQWEADLIVLSARPRNWLAQLFRRRTVEQVVRAAACPVMVLSMDRRGQKQATG